jgi:methionine-S-sulfoxide reductase
MGCKFFHSFKVGIECTFSLSFSTIKSINWQRIINDMEKAIFANGCFWCTEAVFQEVKGVTKVQSGYTGGTVPNPTYEQVAGGNTGHAESLKIEFDPSIITYEDLLFIFWRTHNPTTLNQQGADVGTQYRSAIFYTNEEQKKLAEKSKSEAKRSYLEITKQSLTQDWKIADREMIYFSYLRAAQLSSSTNEQSQLIEEASCIFPDLMPSKEFFPPPFVSKVINQRNIILTKSKRWTPKLDKTFNKILIDGREIDAKIKLNPIVREDHSLIGIAVTIQDISKIKKPLRCWQNTRKKQKMPWH